MNFPSVSLESIKIGSSVVEHKPYPLPAGPASNVSASSCPVSFTSVLFEYDSLKMKLQVA